MFARPDHVHGSRQKGCRTEINAQMGQAFVPDSDLSPRGCLCLSVCTCMYTKDVRLQNAKIGKNISFEPVVSSAFTLSAYRIKHGKKMF